MNRETRINLIFLGIFLAVSLPGAVLLFKKKLDPKSPPLFMPDYIRRRLPYMASQQSPNQVVRFIPDLTGPWVTQINRSRGGGENFLLNGHEAVVSEDHGVQVLSIKTDASGTILNLLDWNEASDVTIQTTTQPPIVGRIEKQEAISLPLEIKKELMNWGVIRPPAAVIYLRVRFDKDLHSINPLKFLITYQIGEGSSKTTTQVQVPPE